MRTFVVAFSAAFAVSLSAAASAQGHLSVRSHASVADRDGAAPAQFFVYDGEGERIASGRPNGAFAAGEAAALSEGWYFVEVGTHRAAGNVRKVYVADAHVTVVPTGWISVQTDPVEQQPSVGCSPWNAELSVFTPDDARALVHSNEGTGVRTWGAVQVVAGEPSLVFFNGFPLRVDAVEDASVELPTGYQDPVAGERPQLSTGPEGADAAIRRPLCEDGGLHVPAGTYYASSLVPIATHPYERREWNAVAVEAHGERLVEELEPGSPLEHPRYAGPGSVPERPGPDDANALARIAGGGGPRLGGFGR